MKNLTEALQESLVNERMAWKTLDDCLAYHTTQAIISAWDELGLEFTHDDIKKALEKLAKEYDVDKNIDWAKKNIK